MHVSANMTQNHWGSVPIAICIANIFSPNHPNGNPQLDELEFRLGYWGISPNDAVFLISKQWD